MSPTYKLSTSSKQIYLRLTSVISNYHTQDIVLHEMESTDDN